MTLFNEESLKSIARRYLYPVLAFAREPYLKYRYNSCEELGVEHIFWGQRSNDYQTHRRRLNKYIPIKGKKVLIIGCGKGEEIRSWLKYKPSLIYATDPIAYNKEWERIKAEFIASHSDTRVVFQQANIDELKDKISHYFDIISSEAVLEHISDLEDSFSRMLTLLSPGGFFYSTWGPLWTSFGGDHVSASKGIEHGYSHLLLSESSYKEHLKGLESHTEYIWHKKGYFSYLRPSQYIPIMTEDDSTRIVYSSALIEPRSLEYLRRFRLNRNRLLSKYKVSDLIVSGMSVIIQKCY